MSIQPEQVPRAGPTPLWALDVYRHPFATRFRGSRQRPTWESLERYVTGLLTDLPRKHCDTASIGGGGDDDGVAAAPAHRCGVGAPLRSGTRWRWTRRGCGGWWRAVPRRGSWRSTTR